MHIHLALTDDWELRGNGSGDIEEIQFRAMRELVDLYDSHGVKSTFNAEVMQQLTFRKLEDLHPQLKPLADAWDEHVRMAFGRGHDIQLHVHPQWSRYSFEKNRWRLSGDWSLLNYKPEAAYSMLSASKQYLEKLLEPLDPNYRCVSFRSGSSAIAPSPFVLSQLAHLGLVFDMSIIQGLRVNTRNLQLDYSACEEGFLPFYPQLNDARKISRRAEPIVCVPIFSFDLSRRRCVAEVLTKVRAQAFSRNSHAGDSYASQEWDDVGRSSLPAKIYDKVVQPCLKGKHIVADIGRLDFPSLREMLKAIREAARKSKQSEVWVILTNHSKYISDFSHIDHFLTEARKHDDISFVTLSTIANEIRAGRIKVKTSRHN
ncbi:MAG TPA: hypothetical protein VFS77_14535 [Pyrinomonadaceae bacterium]|nr:hypothetical protein [Pyrinomonadaceae bacterium]